MIILAAITMYSLMVIIGGSSPHTYKRGDYHSFDACVTAAHAEVETLGPNVSWACVPRNVD
jgi:hypothetical protein